MSRPKAFLSLSNGQRLSGELIGAEIPKSGEMVFTTGMVGYSEALTDPSYFGQILVFSYPLIGNYGIPPLPRDTDDIPPGFESRKIQASAVIMTVDSPEAFHWNSFQSLEAWLKKEGIPGMVGLDTRHLVHLIRSSGNLRGIIETEEKPNLAMEFYDPSEHDVLHLVSGKIRKIVGRGKTRVAVVDCGVKWNIIRQLLSAGCEVEIIPWDTDLSSVDAGGWLLSNGPGDPLRTGQLCQMVGNLIRERKRPILGICLGNQILALAAGAMTIRLPFGHRSHNQPVFEQGTRSGYITSQNHGYVVDEDSLPEGWTTWFRNANDGTIEGLKHETGQFLGVQFHPEASGGPRDTGWIIEKFVSLMR